MDKNTKIIVKRKRVQVHFPEQTLTKQAFRDECNVNTIMQKYQKTGLLPHVNAHKGFYGDFTDVQDYQTSLNQVMAAQDMFSELPSSIRIQFDNDPAKFLHFVGDPENRDQMREMGLLREEVSAPNVAPLPPEIQNNTSD